MIPHAADADDAKSDFFHGRSFFLVEIGFPADNQFGWNAEADRLRIPFPKPIYPTDCFEFHLVPTLFQHRDSTVWTERPFLVEGQQVEIATGIEAASRCIRNKRQGRLKLCEENGTWPFFGLEQSVSEIFDDA
jgi:hypothetical protein